MNKKIITSYLIFSVLYLFVLISCLRASSEDERIKDKIYSLYKNLIKHKFLITFSTVNFINLYISRELTHKTK